MATIFYTAATVDGFLATPDHSLDWLTTRDIDPEGPMHYDAFIAQVGALATGSHTYEWVLEHQEGRWGYDQPTWVFSSRDLPRAEGADLRFVSGDVRPVHKEMVRAAGARDVWVVGGGGLAAQLAEAGLLDELWVQWAPVTLGAGTPLLPGHVELRLEDVARNRDFVCARYSVVR